MKHNAILILFIIILYLDRSVCFSQQTQKNHDSTTIAFVSDTQAPLFFERMIHQTNHNKKATELIFNDIVARRPASLFILGDVVSLGYSKYKWKQMDGYLAICRQNNIPVYAALGNHELMLHAKKGAAKFQSRFAMHSPTGYVTIIDSIAIVLINSNFNKMTTLEIDQQDKWYVQKIKQLNADSAVKFIIVGCHHSPFTNSKVVAPSKMIQEKILPAFLSTKKCALFLSGHSHNFERFNFQGKELLVIGGGGGIHQLLKTGEKTTPDLAAAYKPMFHYLTIKRTGNLLEVISHPLKKDFSGFKEGLKFTVQ